MNVCSKRILKSELNIKVFDLNRYKDKSRETKFLASLPFIIYLLLILFKVTSFKSSNRKLQLLAR